MANHYKWLLIVDNFSFLSFKRKWPLKPTCSYEAFEGNRGWPGKKEWILNKSWNKYPESGELYMLLSSGHYFHFIVRLLIIQETYSWVEEISDNWILSVAACLPDELLAPMSIILSHQIICTIIILNIILLGIIITTVMIIDHRCQGNIISHHHTWWWWWWSISLTSSQTRSSTSLPSSSYALL